MRKACGNVGFPFREVLVHLLIFRRLRDNKLQGRSTVHVRCQISFEKHDRWGMTAVQSHPNEAQAPIALNCIFVSGLGRLMVDCLSHVGFEYLSGGPLVDILSA